MSAAWSPDSRHFVSQGDGGGVIHDADGIDGPHVAMRSTDWLDDAHVVGFAELDGRDQPEIIDLETNETEVVQPPRVASDLLANGHGAVALTWDRGNQLDSPSDHVIWQSGDFTDVADGYPAAWSVDGTKLALYHAVDRVRGPNGWVSVVSWPGQGSLYSDAAQSAAGDVLFSPSGGYVAYSTALSETPAGPFVVRLVDLQDGSSVDVPRENSGSFCWMSGDQLAVVHDDLTMTTYNAAGEAIGQATAPDSWATASQDGSTVVFWNPDQGSDAPAVLRAGSLTTLQAPAEVWHVYPSPDGSRLVVGTAGYRSYLTTF